MYGQGNYPPQFRPSPFHQSQPNPPPPPPPFQQAPPGQQPPPISYNPPHSLIHQAPPGPPHYQHNAPPAPQPGPSYLRPPSQPYLPPPPQIQGSSQMPLPYSQSSNSYPLRHVSQPMPPPPVFRLPPPPPHPQGQVLYQTPPPPPPRIQPMPAPPPPPPPSSGFVPVTPPAYSPYGHSTAGDVFPPPLPPPSPPPPPSSPPPLPPSPPPPTSPNPATKDIADASVAFNENEVNISGRGHVVEGETSGLSLPPPKPTNEEVVHNIEVLCKFMVKIGPHFENLARTKEAGNPNFSFLFGGEPGSDAAIGYEYFQWMKRKCLLQKDSLKDQDQNVSPAASDMDMEDDVNQPDADKEIDESFKESTGKAISIGTSPAPNTTEQITAEVAASNTNLTISELTRVHHDGEDDKDSSFIEDVSPIRDSPDAVEHALENNVQGSNRIPTEDSCLIKVSSTFTEGRTMEAPTENVEHVSPFRLIQGYASDDSEEDDKEENAEDSDADSMYPTTAAGISVMHEDKRSKSSSSVGPSNDSVKEVLPKAKKDESLDDLAKEVLDLPANNDRNDKIVECESIQKNDLLGGNNLNAKNQIGKHQLEEDAKESIKLNVDEFGRIVRKGASDSDSEEMHFRGRHVKRGRNRSRSPPQESRWRRRSRSPRRRDKRSGSRSWSPKRTRSKSPPAFKRTKVSSRQDREQPPECLDFNRGRCFRGASCRFLHRNSTRHMNRQHQYPHTARDFATYVRHDASPPMLADNDAHHEDAKSIEMHAEDRVDKDASALTEDNAQPTGRNNIGEVQVTDQITQEVSRMEESEVEDVLEAPNDLNEEERTKPLLKSSQSLQAEIMVAQSSSGSVTQASQITQPTSISEPQGPQGLQYSHQELASHPSPSLPAKPTSLQNLPPYIGQTYSNQSPISHSNPIYISSNPNPSLPPKEFPPPRFLGADGNFQPPQQVPPGPPPPTHLPSDNLSSQFGFQPQKNFISHQPPVASDYHSQSALPPNPVWPNIPPPPPSHSMPLRHEFNPLIRPNFYVDEFKSRPLPITNPHEHPFMRDRFAYPPMPEGSLILPDSQREYQLRSQSFLPREELSAPAIKDLPFSHHPPPYGAQPPANINYPLNLSTSGSVEPSLQRFPSSFLDNNKPPHFNPFASTFEQVPTNSKFVSSVSGQENDGNHSSKYDSFTSGHVPPGGSNSRLTASPPNLKRHGDAYDPLFDSIEPNSINASKLDSLHKSSGIENSKLKGSVGDEDKLEVDEFGDVATDAEAGAVENVSPNPVDEKDWSPGLPIDTGNEEGGEIEIDQVQSLEKSKRSKDSRSMKLFKIAIAEFVKEVLKPSWRQGNMSKEAFKTIVKKTVDKVSGAMPSHQIPKSQAKINQYVESSQRKLTKLVMGYVDKYVKM